MRKRVHETAGRWVRAAAAFVVVWGVVAMPSRALAQGEVTGVIGGMLGGDLNNLVAGTSTLKSTFDNGPVYGVRAGYLHGWIGGEGSFVMSPTGVSIQAPTSPLGLDAKVYYLEAKALLVPIPGPVSPFFAIGAGWHSYDFSFDTVSLGSSDAKVQKFGWTFGGGLKINIKALTLRGEIHDHLTKVGPRDFDIAGAADALGITNEATLHNVEISGGIGVRF